jgi:hypothetical protein
MVHNEVHKNNQNLILFIRGNSIEWVRLSPLDTQTTTGAPDVVLINRWSESWQGKQVFEENLLQCHDKSHITWPGFESRPCGGKLATNCLSRGTA